MDVVKNSTAQGKVQVSTDVIISIAKVAALEIPCVAQLSKGNLGVKSILQKVACTNPINVVMQEGVAQIDLYVILDYDAKVRHVAGEIQDNVKSCVQNMTGISVSKVNVIVAGINDPQ